MEYSLSEPSIVDKIIRGEVKIKEENTSIDERETKSQVSLLLDSLREYNPRYLHDKFDFIIIDTKKYLIIIAPLGKKITLIANKSLEIFENMLKILEKYKGDKKIVLIYFSPGGRLLLSAYLFLGYLIEKHNIGILFINGDVREVKEVIESLRKEGSFIPQEEDYIDFRVLS